jgi:hypothetical protein
MGVPSGRDLALGSGVGSRMAGQWDGVLHRNDLRRARTCGNERHLQKPIRSTGRCADGVQPWEQNSPDGLPDLLLLRPGPPPDRFGVFRAPGTHENFRFNGSSECRTENAGTSSNAFIRTSFSPSSKPHPDRVGPSKAVSDTETNGAIRARDGHLPHTIRGRISCFTEFPFLLLCRC